MEAARRVLQATPTATAGEISRAVKKEYGLNLSPKTASTYKYYIQKKSKSAGTRSPVRSTAGSSDIGGRTSQAAGVDDLLRAAQKLGWRRVKEVVDLVIQAPA
jgi:hypothetical protein